MARHVMCTELDTVLVPRPYWKARLVKVSPVAKNLWKCEEIKFYINYE